MKDKIYHLIQRAVQAPDLLPEEWAELLALTDYELQKILHRSASDLRVKLCGDAVALRGLVEISNICTKNCYYCGIRRENFHIPRFELDLNEIVDTALLAQEFRYGSVVLQSGERTDTKFIDKISEAVSRIKKHSKNSLGITLSCGEQERAVYKEWFSAGAHRYLLRIETSNRKLYSQLHPANHDFDKRVECLHLLKECGYQLGTGIMCGLPGQTTLDIIRDIEFFADIDADMIGMGPYIVQQDTPLAKFSPDFESEKSARLDFALNMIAIVRLRLRDVNIAATTALHALAPDGRERGLQAGANVIMPNITPTRFRSGYQLYDGKPGLNENADSVRKALQESISSAGFRTIDDAWGDSRHFKNKNQ